MARNGVDLNLPVLLLAVLAQPGPQHPGAQQSGQAAHHMNDRRSGKVHISQLDQPALAVPHPAGFNGVDNGADKAGVDTVCQKFGTLRHCAGDDGRRRGTEHQLEKEIGPVKVIEACKHLVLRHADQAKEIVFTVHNAVAQQDKHHRADAKVHQILHNDVSRVFCPGEASLHHCKAALHEEHQNCAHQEPH